MVISSDAGKPTGRVTVAGNDANLAQQALERIEATTATVQVGKIYNGVVSSIKDFGAFVEILPGKEGLLHISQIAHERVENVTDYLSEGEELKVKVLDVDNRGRIKLSRKELIEKAAPAAE